MGSPTLPGASRRLDNRDGINMVFVNENKEHVEIIVKVSLQYNGCTYRVEDIYITPYRKRKPISIAAQVRDRYEYRCLDREKRGDYVRQEYLKYCTEEQVWEAVQEAYRELTPKKEDVVFRAV